MLLVVDEALGRLRRLCGGGRCSLELPRVEGLVVVVDSVAGEGLVGAVVEGWRVGRLAVVAYC